MLGSLKQLDVGEAWVYSPGWLRQPLHQIRFRPIETLDTHATPRPGRPAATARKVAAVDIEALGEVMAELVEQRRLDDPTALRARIRELEEQLARQRAQTAEPTIVERVIERTVPVMPDLSAMQAAADATIARLEEATRQAREELNAAVDAVSAQVKSAHEEARQQPVTQDTGNIRPAPSTRAASASATGSHMSSAPPVDARPSVGAEVQLGKAHRSILTVAATYGPRPVASVAVLAGYSHKGGGFRNAISSLRSNGLIEGRGEISITDAGREALGPVPQLPTGTALREHWKSQAGVPSAAGKVLDILAQRYPHPVSIEDLAAATGYEPSGGGFRNALSRLRSLGLAHGRGELAIDHALI